MTVAAVKRKEPPGARLRCNGRLTPSTCLHIVKAFMAFPLARLLYVGAGPGRLARCLQVLSNCAIALLVK
jgi:hypothetical protein